MSAIETLDSTREHIMTDFISELPEMRELAPAEISGVSGAFNNMGPVMAAGAAVLRFIDDINLQFYGCFTDDGKTTCVYSYDL
jgi:hypothetical protein